MRRGGAHHALYACISMRSRRIGVRTLAVIMRPLQIQITEGRTDLMCGIIGYVGPQGSDVTSILLEGLRKLEYRGYDSAGIAVLTANGDLELRRRAGKIANLATEVENDSRPASGSLGIGHTRWATHGRPNDTNAHPHPDCTGILTVVHNGIIENYAQL